MRSFLEAAAIRCGGTEAAVEAINAKIRDIEVARGIPRGRSRATVHPTTWRAWTRGSRPRYAIVIQAVCDVTGHTAEELGWLRSSLDDVDRRGFLASSAAAVVSGALFPLLGELGAPPEPDLERYELKTAQLWTDYWTLDPVSTAYAAADHAEHGRMLLGRSRGQDHRQIADTVGVAMILVGRVAFFDLGRKDVAERVWGIAGDYLEQSEEPLLKACLHGHNAFIPGWAGLWVDADAELRLAAGYARRGGGPGLRAWVHAVAAECLTRAGQTDGGLREIDRARETLIAGGVYTDPWWLDYFNGQRLDGFDAAVALAAARAVLSSGTATPRATRHAFDRIQRALGHLTPAGQVPTQYTIQDCVTVLDRATAHALVHDDDQALTLAASACQALARRPYATARSRLDTLSDSLPASRIRDLFDIEQSYLAA